MKLLENKVVLVTGASRGIGKSIALAMAEQGAYVVVNYNGSEAAANAVVEEITAKGGQAMAYQCMVADFAAVETMMKTLYKQLGHIDVLVNNAGITRDELLMKMKEADLMPLLILTLRAASIP